MTALLTQELYDELLAFARHALVRERRDHTLAPTDLVHEAYVRLIGGDGARPASRAEFQALAATVMRRVLVDHARTRSRLKRGGGRRPESLEAAFGLTVPGINGDFLDVVEELERLLALDPDTGRIVELRLFSGLSRQEIADHLGRSVREVDAAYCAGRAYLRRKLRDEERAPR